MSKIKMYTGFAKSERVYNIAIVVSEFNETVTEALLRGALKTLEQNNITSDHIEVYRVPGAFEIPLTCKRIFSKKNSDGIIALGAVIRGETPHFDYVAGQCASGIQSVSLEFNKPVAFGVLTTNTIDEALNRAGLKYGNKGSDCANSLLQQLRLYDESSL